MSTVGCRSASEAAYKSARAWKVATSRGGFCRACKIRNDNNAAKWDQRTFTTASKAAAARTTASTSSRGGCFDSKFRPVSRKSFPAYLKTVRACSRSMATHTKPYEAVVVGAGPAGICCMGNLIARNLSPILWVDDGFDGGRINRMYREVPSNTKVKRFMEYATGVEPFNQITGSKGRDSDNKIQFMLDLDQEQGCRLGYAADMSLVLTEGLRSTPGVDTEQGRVSSAVLNENSSPSPSSRWSVNMDSTYIGSQSNQTSTVSAQRLIFCTGSSPNNSPLPVYIPHVRNMDLDIALSPSRLRAALAAEGPTTISVIGASHSAIIVLMNLYNLAASSRPDLRIRWFTRHDLRYAVEMDGWILRDNTGLKGDAATWAKENLEPEVFQSSNVSKYMERIDYKAGDEEGIFEERIPGSQFYVQAIGYSRNPLPVLKTNTGEEITPQFDHEKGSFGYQRENSGRSKRLSQIPGLFGAGIAFPERVQDPYGNVEMAVGFGKFMKFVKRVVNDWN